MNIIYFICGFLVGVGLVLLINWIRKKDAQTIAQALVAQTETQKMQDVEGLLNRIKDSFGAISLDILSKNTEAFLKLANETLSKQTQIGEKELEGKQKLIDQTLQSMKSDLLKLQDLVTQFEKDREQKFGALATQLQLTAEQTRRLYEVTGQLQSALASSKVRGQWGERMAEDVLRLAGFIEGINYFKQQKLETGTTRPDYTFFLPQGLKLNMDVKFPLDNFIQYMNATTDAEKEAYKKQFLKDVRSRIKAVTTRDYINPEEHTVDYVLVFIPNEQVYGFIHAEDTTLLDDALKNKVILCSPITLYAILAVIRQAVDNFNLEETATHILSLLGTFYKEWHAFLNTLEKMGKRIEDAQKEYTALITTRKNKLDKALAKIEELRVQKQLPIPEIIDTQLIEQEKVYEEK
ncbi:MAG: DNA recombination protein RmuC [bacterium]|nr:DNA recombination protein RmuC [bacterium]